MAHTTRSTADIPPAATTWRLHQVVIMTRKRKGGGGSYPQPVTKRLTGDTDDEGEVADCWPVEEFSVKAIRERWGSGRYKIEWFDNKGDKLSDRKFDVAEPPRRKAARELEEDDDARGSARRMPETPFEWMMWSEQRAESERLRAREEADQRAQRDRDFLQQVIGVRGSLAAPSSAAPSVDITQTLALFEQRIGVMMQQQQLATRSMMLDQREAELDAEPEAETFTDALNSAGVAVVEGLGEEMPELIGDALSKFKAYLRTKGAPTDPQSIHTMLGAAMQAIEAQAQPEPKGAGGGSNDNGASGAAAAQ